MPQTVEQRLERIESLLVELLSRDDQGKPLPERIKASQLSQKIGVDVQAIYKRIGYGRNAWYRVGTEVFNEASPDSDRPSWRFDWRKCMSRDLSKIKID